ncbi:TIGR03087 family PEP-CTERM/XrtA system glycosyltransferase [Sphingomonas bacterium]|uniref:TIGR03087 family PEP-CTERM/XrtA system glycosyltransferase n=1 Tax=Sphingomonas bacterium TaxID=1895847 RepID=UPI001575AA7D|nr:TIGR03087 family PEP-CTERM/XrtA system glycosyltransferase [Sphingomonas bacterium]
MEILFLAHRCPYPPDRGDRIRSWHVLRHLATRARVHLIALDEEVRTPPPELAALLASCTIVPRTKSRARAAAEALATGRPVSLAAFAHPAVREAVARVLRQRPIRAIYVFSGQMAQYLPTGAPKAIMDFVDVDSAKFAAMAQSGPAARRWLLRREARLLGRFERAVSARVAASLFVSDAEAALFRSTGGEGEIVAVENGIDFAHYDPAAVAPQPVARPTIVFTGQMDYQPNVDAVQWFASTVLPLIRDRHADAALAIVGRAPTAAVRSLAGEHIIVTGAVDDTRPWLAAAAVCVAPLLLARGIQNKVLEAMAMARPVVASPAAAEGIDHRNTIRVADGADVMAAAIGALLDDPITAGELGQAARRQVERRYYWDARLAPLDALLGLPAERRAA